jgi:hypothetical protein
MKKLLTYLTLGLYTCTYAQNDASKSIVSESENLKKAKEDSLSNWQKGGIVTISGQQVSLTNWAAGGQSAISANGLLNLFATYKKGRNTWSSTLDLAYGVIRQGENKNWWKNDDRIQITSKYGRQAFDHVFYTGLLDFKTQFSPGFNYPNDSVIISDFLAPGYGLVALGMDYKPNDNFSLLVAPVTGKFTIVNNRTLADAGAFGVDKAELFISPAGDTTITKRGRIIREEFGGYLKMQYKDKIMENVDFSTTLELFTNYLENPGNFDVNWTTLTSMKVNKYISATLSTQLIYDDDIKVLRSSGSRKGSIGPDVQFKQVLGIGFSYKF